MKQIITFLSILLLIFNFHISSAADGDILELYHNYTLLGDYYHDQTYYFYPHFEVGDTITFIIVNSNNRFVHSLDIYNGNNRIQTISSIYYYFVIQELKAPDPAPSFLRIKTHCSSFSGKYTYYLYIFNKDFKIPLKFPNYFVNTIYFNELVIPYEIIDLPENKKIILEAKIGSPDYDSLQININQNSYIFNETSSREILLEKDYTYTIEIMPILKSENPRNTYIMIYFAEERDFNTLFYPEKFLTYNTILNKKWYIIDSVNSIDEYNKYNLVINQGYNDNNGNDNNQLKYNIKIKTYQTNDISYIKQNIPALDEDYEEIIEPLIEKSLNFTVCEKSCLNANTILIVIDLNYFDESSILYQYSINKIIENKELEFRTYDISWYTYYEFNPLYVRSKDTIFISTNHSKTISYFNSNNYKKFSSFYNGQLYISFPDDNSNRNQIKLLYSDKLAKMENNRDRGNLAIYRFESFEMSFSELNLDEYKDIQFYMLELKKNQDKYIYIKMIKNWDYYIFYDGKEDYSFFVIESMPVSILKFAQYKFINDTSLMTYKNEYLVKIGYTDSIFGLINLYIIKNEISKTIYLEEGKPKIFTFPKDEDNITIQINLVDDDISYINLRIPLKNIASNLYITCFDKTYILNNEGINIENLKKENKIILTIKNEDNIQKDIPILIKAIIPTSRVILLSQYNKYNFDQNKYGIIKLNEDKKANIKFRTSSPGVEISYYYGYLSSDFTNQIKEIVNPKLFNKTISFNDKEYNFEIKTEVELNRNFNGKNKYLYLIFSLNKDVEVSTGDVDILYNKLNLAYTTIYSNNKWYIIDSINSIDNINSYILKIKEGYNSAYSSIFDIRIKRYETYDTNYIKNNIPILDDDYDEEIKLESNNIMNFVTCRKINCQYSKTILIQIELNYNCSFSNNYTYELQKSLGNQIIDFKSYDIKWYTTYQFKSVQVKNNDIIFISTKYPNTIYPIEKDNNYKKFESFYNGYLFVSLPSNEVNERNLFNIEYSDEKIKNKDEENYGHIEIFKFGSENMSFEKLYIDDMFESKIYNFELNKNNGKYYYIQINGNEKYYIFYDGDINSLVFRIESMPVDIIKFSNNINNNDILLLSNKNEYLLKIGNSNFEYNLINMYIIKNENSKILNLEEGKIKIVTYSPNENILSLEINMPEEEISKDTYINLKIPSQHIIGNLYISYDNNLYSLNNTGINIYCKDKNKIILNIEDKDKINKEIPILIKLIIRPEQLKIININDLTEIFQFDHGQYGIIKYNENKVIKLKFKMSYENIIFGYYNYYLPDDFISDTSNIIHPGLFNKIKFDQKEHIFELKTELHLERNNNLKKENLYLIFCFDGKTEISTMDFYSLYGKSKLTFSTVLSNNIWYIVDTVNLIDNFNKYQIIMNGDNQDYVGVKFNIRIKKYETYDIEYIKRNIHNSNEYYDEEKNITYVEGSTFSVYEQYCCHNNKAILIEIKFSDINQKNNLYKISIQKLLDNKPLEFQKYDINMYTNYDFSPITVFDKDIIIISTINPNTVFLNLTDNYRKFKSFCNGMMFISSPEENSNSNLVKISYSNINIIPKNEGDIGHIELLKLNYGEATFDMIDINEIEISKLYIFELNNNKQKYFYIKNDKKDNYYLFSDSNDKYIFLKIDQMPTDAIKFSEKYYNNDIRLITTNNEYLARIGYNNSIYGLVHMYIIKEDNSEIIDLEEGQIKIITFLYGQNEKKIKINFISKEITNETYVNIKLPQSIINKEISVSYLDINYYLDNKGVNIYNLEQKNSIALYIKKINEIYENIPILIKFGIGKDNIQFVSPLSSNDKYEFYPGKFGIIKYLNNKTINMKLKTNITNNNINYYSCYLSEDLNEDISNILNPKYFNSTKINSEDYFFEIKTILDIVKEKTNMYNNFGTKLEYLYLIFSFDEKTEIIMKESQPTPSDDESDEPEPEPSSSEPSPSESIETSEPFDIKIIIIVACCCVSLIIIVLIIALLCRKKRNNNDTDKLLNDLKDNKKYANFQIADFGDQANAN